jgi:hypothetical protein
MSEEDLRSIMLSDEELKEKEQESINNQIKRLESKQKDQLSLENLKKSK